MMVKTKALKWELVPWVGNPSMGSAWRAYVGKGALWLLPFDTRGGVKYCSSFGPNADNSFSGYLPGLTIEEAKRRVLTDAQQHWVGGT